MAHQLDGMRLRSCSLRFWCGLLSLGLVVGAAPARAQEPAAGDQPNSASKAPPASETTPAPGARPAAEKSSTGPAAYPFDIRYLEGPDGRPVAVPDKATFEEFLKWWAQQQFPEGPPAAAVSSLLFDGTVVDDRVRLTASIEIVVTRETGWVRVPLYMSEAMLRDAPVYSGPGRAVPGPILPDVGYVWWITGKGTHILTLPLSVPLLKLATQNRMQMSLPATAARSKLTLKIDSPRILPKVPESSTLKTKPVSQGTEIEVIGLGNRIDLAWQTLPDVQPAETALEVTTSVVATLVDGESVTLEATQRIQSLGQQGQFDELRVSLPPGCDLLRLDGREHRDHRVDPANPQQVVVQLKKATSGPVDLKWAVRSKLPAVGKTFTLEGFEVDRARLQTGYLALVVVGDFRIVPEEDRFSQRIDVADLPGSMRQVAAKASYRFLNRLLLRLSLQRIEPHVTVEPSVLLHLASDSAEVEGVFRLQVLRGSINSFRMRWANWKQQGWTITEAELPGHVELRHAEAADDPDVLQFDFLEAAKGTIDIRFRARRALAGGGDPVSLTVPVPESKQPFSTRLAILSADNVELELRPSDSTVLHALGEPIARIPAPREWQSLRRLDYRLESPNSELTVALSVHSRRIQGTSEVEAFVRSGAVTIRQKFLFDVAYERIAQLRFSVPEGVSPEQVKFYGADDRTLPALFVSAGARSPAELRVTLDSPVLGRFEIEARYALPGLPPAAGAQPLRLSIPLMRPHEIELSETRLSCRDAAGREAIVDGAIWQRRLAPDGTPVWTTDSVPQAVELAVAHAASAINRMQVAKTLIRTVVGAGGTIENRAQYRLSEGISELSVAFPRDLKPTKFFWNRGELAVGAPVATADGSMLYEIVIPDRTATTDRLLTINFRSPTHNAGRFGGAYALEAPRLPDDLRIGQVFWQVELPYHEHLFTEPIGYSPDFHWVFGKSLWSRQPDMNDLELQQWIGTAAGPAPLAAPMGENRYLFGTSDGTPDLNFQALRKWSLTLIGAGTALGLGLVLMRWPVVRHPATMLAVAFAMALAGVWFPGPVVVLMQPALLGVTLALLAVAIKSYQQRWSSRVLVTLGSASPVAAPLSSHVPGPVVGIGSDEYTSLRPPADVPRGPAPISSQGSARLSESGSRL